MNFLSKVSLVAIVSLSVAMAQDSLRRPAPAAALPAPAAAGQLRILLVDDDFSDNNNNPKDTRQTPSDIIFRQVIANAVGGNAKAWEIEYVKPYESGPGIDRLRPFSLIVWYTGAIYGGNPDNSGVLSIEDEKVVRRYLEEVGGTVILFSPGYLSKVLGASGTWEKGAWPFLSEVIGARGGTGLAQRFLPGTVTAPDGTQFNVDKGSASVESQFSLLNPDGATVLFTTVPAAAKPGSAAAPVATAHAYGRGRFIYVGFTFENLGSQERAPMFGRLLAASGLQSKPGAGPVVAAAPAATAAPVASATVAEPAAVQVTGTPAAAEVRWNLQTATLTNASLGGAGQTTTRVQPRPAATQAATVKVERLVPNGTPVRLNVATADALRASDTGPFAPGKPVTYRVTLTDAQGRSGYKEASFTPQARDPDSLTATVQADGTVILVWPEVPGVTGYQVSGTALAAPVSVNRATEWRSAKVAGSQKWQVASMYAPGGVLTASSAWPSATSRVIPVPGRPFLSMPNGAGSYAFTQAHYRSQCIDALAPGSLCHAADFFNAATNWEEAWLAWNGVDDAPAKWPRVFSFSRLDLGVYRQSNCAPPRNGSITCWAFSHRGVTRAAKPESLSVIIMNGDKSFFGVWEFPGETLAALGWHESAFDFEHSFAIQSTLVAGSALDSQGRKNVPHACLSCHGGYYDATSKRVVGASLLPLIPARSPVDTIQDSVTRVIPEGEENTRVLNQIVLQSNPAPAIIDQINALYDGAPNTPGKRANNTAVPSGWRTQQGLYKKVIEPYCSTCHFAQRGPLNLRSWGNALQNKDAIQRTMCTEFTMPHSEIQFRKFWSEDNGAAPRLLSTALGFQTCG